MLRRLELVGFKSFADKTTFNFDEGITGIVGPNGSGKSNIVDAVRWILGEQSAKSLRGGEMADVIFNGSTSRGSFGLAEVTMTFDNRRRLLATEADEVQITRRVYRSGEGEYLINQQPCRLKDIKDLFLGSGAGTDAYCIIEQGRVDVLLQASTKDRRTIFEEAAGISRFKAKKVETLRKLERVDQNLQRLQDIIDEVERQLRSVKLQAAKAQRFQEYRQRLQDLRIGLGLREYQHLTRRLQSEALLLEKLRTELDQRAQRAEELETLAEQAGLDLTGLEDQLRTDEAGLARVRQQLQVGETTLEHEGQLTQELEKELIRTRSRLTSLNARLSALEEAMQRSQEELTQAETQANAQRQEVEVLEEALRAIVSRQAEVQQQIETDKASHLDYMRQAAHLQNEAVSHKAHVDNLRREGERLRLRSAQAAENLASIDLELQELAEADEALQQRLAAARQTLNDSRQQRDRLRQATEEAAERMSTLLQQRSGLASRLEVLEGLIRSHEGLGTGVREVFALIEQPEPGPWRTVLGMVADFLTVRREHAPLIDLALGDLSQRFVVSDMALLEQALAQRPLPFSGRVSFMPLLGKLQIADGGLQIAEEDTAIAPGREKDARGSGQGSGGNEGGSICNLPSAICHAPVVADQLVLCDQPELAKILGHHLGRTLIVPDLAAARALTDRYPGRRLITLAGEVMEPDGTLSLGPIQTETGLLSRKSEQRELVQLLADVDRTVGDLERRQLALRQQLEEVDSRLGEQQEETDVLAEQAADLRNRLQLQRDRRQGLHEEVVLNQDECQRVEQEIAELDTAWQQACSQAAAAEAQVQILHERLHLAEHDLRALEQHRQQRQLACTAGHVALAKAEERLSALSDLHRQRSEDWQQCCQDQKLGDQGLANCCQRLLDSQLKMLQASAALAQGYLDKEAAQRRVAELVSRRDHQRLQRQELANQSQIVRNEWRVLQEHFHSRQMENRDQEHQRTTMVERLREDFQVDLEEMYRLSGQMSEETSPGSSGPEAAGAGLGPPEEGAVTLSAAPATLYPDTEAANAEIADLRRKLERLGNVNTEALEELQSLETRQRELTTQRDDLTTARRSLQEIIDKINQDSRRMFTDTFQAIRGHFQELFRKLFGGGMADIVVEDENDILESGIEIIARPPGKELRSISLMSGGEKTLTAVALLMAIFRNRPSPFCILDEVDAALDEANIDRFTAVVREFLDRSQFIIVTHSKKTMSAADVLYGITMQESGISKQVAVRFEDWEERNGRPTPTAQAS